MRKALFLAVLVCGTIAPQTVQAQQTTSTTSAYLGQALDLMQQHSLFKKTIDWPELRKKAFAMAADAKEPVETYDSIRFALGELGDHHSFLSLSGELQQKEAAYTARCCQTETYPQQTEKPSPYTDRHEPEGTIVTVAHKRIAHLTVPFIAGADDGGMHRYTKKLQGLVATLAKDKPVGWIVDLRGNFGGNLWPMLAGVGPLLESGPLGAFVDDNGKKDVWFYAEDGAGANTKDGQRQILCWVPAEQIRFRRPQIIAVLIDGSTASSGEALAIAFEGRALTKTFGRHSHGESTSNDGFPLSDGASLVITDGIDEDRTGKLYPAGIQPDLELPIETRKTALGQVDAVTVAAGEWIVSQTR